MRSYDDWLADDPADAEEAKAERRERIQIMRENKADEERDEINSAR